MEPYGRGPEIPRVVTGQKGEPYGKAAGATVDAGKPVLPRGCRAFHQQLPGHLPQQPRRARFRILRPPLHVADALGGRRPGFRPRPRRQGSRKRGDRRRGRERHRRGGGRSVGGLRGPRRGPGVPPDLVRVQPRADGARLRRLGGAAGAAGDLRHAHRHRAAAVVLLRPRGGERVRDRQPARVGAPAGLRPGGLLAPGDSRWRPISAAGRGRWRRRSPTAAT